MGCGEKKTVKILDANLHCYCNVRICRQATLLSEAERLKVADAVIEAHRPAQELRVYRAPTPWKSPAEHSPSDCRAATHHRPHLLSIACRSVLPIHHIRLPLFQSLARSQLQVQSCLRP